MKKMRKDLNQSLIECYREQEVKQWIGSLTSGIKVGKKILNHYWNLKMIKKRFGIKTNHSELSKNQGNVGSSQKPKLRKLSRR